MENCEISMNQSLININDLPDVDKKIIENVPWARTMREDLLFVVEKTFLNWTSIVLNMGNDEQGIKVWSDQFAKSIKNTCSELQTSMVDLQNSVLSNIEIRLRELQEICKLLKIPMPHIGAKSLGLYKELQQLKMLIAQYQTEIKTRQDEINCLNKEHKRLCNVLSRDGLHIPLPLSPLPSRDELENFKQEIKVLEQEMYDRDELFLNLKEEILNINQELQFKPETKFEKLILVSRDISFVVTNENMDKLKKLKEYLHEKLEDNKEEAGKLRKQIEEFWNILDVDMIERERFRKRLAGNSVGVLEALKKEQKRCQRLKMENIKIFVDKLHAELERMWNVCQCDVNERANFDQFDCYTEDLLSLHELELNKWRKYYEENKKLVTMLNKHRELWDKMLEFERKAEDPNRFKNRGGQLLQEEKERGKLAKHIPKIEEALLELDEKYLRENGQNFKTFGVTVVDYLNNVHRQRELDKKQKLSSRKTKDKTPNSNAAGASMSRRFRLTPGKSATPSVLSLTKVRSVDKIKKDASRIHSLKSPTGNKVTVPVVTGVARRRSDRLRRKPKTNASSKSVNNNRSDKENTISEEYLAFQEDLSNKKDSRSTLIDEASKQAKKPKMPAKQFGNRLQVPGLTSALSTPLRSPSSRLNTDRTLTRSKSNLKLLF